MIKASIETLTERHEVNIYYGPKGEPALPVGDKGLDNIPNLETYTMPNNGPEVSYQPDKFGWLPGEPRITPVVEEVASDATYYVVEDDETHIFHREVANSEPHAEELAKAKVTQLLDARANVPVKVEPRSIDISEILAIADIINPQPEVPPGK